MIKTLHNLFLESSGISTDTRHIVKGNIFFALTGDNFNGNTYAEKALQLGASYAVVDEDVYATHNTKCILVTNVLKTLQDLALFHRTYLNIPIIALTGSNGKTTTKELINSVLSKTYKTVATKGNLNNHIGVPLTLLSMSKDTEIGIVEMGANHLKEIELLCQIARPNIGYITNFGKAHLEGFGSEEGVIKGKSELYDYLRKNNELIIVNADDTMQLQQSKHGKIFTFGTSNSNNVKIEFVDANPLVNLLYNSEDINSQLIGAYNASNISGAIAIGHYFNVPTKAIKEAIESYIPKNNRSQIITKDNLTIILDAYNANPSSMKAALNNLEQLDSKDKIVILGDMFELGQTTKLEHQNIAEIALQIGLQQIILVGSYFKDTNIKSSKVVKFETTKLLLESNILKTMPKEGTLLIKGSRGMALERVLERI